MNLAPSERDTMRAMTAAEAQSWYEQHRWPCCGGTVFERGPRAGMSVNLRCPVCDMRINVIDPDSIWAAAGSLFGQVLREPAP